MLSRRAFCLGAAALFGVERAAFACRDIERGFDELVYDSTDLILVEVTPSLLAAKPDEVALPCEILETLRGNLSGEITLICRSKPGCGGQPPPAPGRYLLSVTALGGRVGEYSGWVILAVRDRSHAREIRARVKKTLSLAPDQVPQSY